MQQMTLMTSAAGSHRHQQSSPVQVQRFGEVTSIPDLAICRVSFYLKCCVHGCGMIDASVMIDPQFLDYGNAHTLGSPEQLYVLSLAVGAFSLDRLINRVVFLDDEKTLLPHDVSNAFFKIGTASTIFNIHDVRDPDDPHSSMQTGKVMVCTSRWIHEIYLIPIYELQDSFRNIPLYSPFEPTLHCVHCKGTNGYCTCEAGCNISLNSCCVPMHRGVVCCECTIRGGFITGTRYRCRWCKDCNLCESCYLSGDHDQTHAFDKLLRTNIRPQKLLPRTVVLTSFCKETLSSLVEAIPTAEAVEIETATILRQDEQN